MASFGKKKKISEYVYSRPVVFFLGVLVVFLSFSVYERYTVEREMFKRTQEAQLQKQELIERKQTLEKRVEYLNGERGIEEEIRTHFDVAKQGEKVVVLVGDDTAKKASTTEAVTVKPWYQFW